VYALIDASCFEILSSLEVADDEAVDAGGVRVFGEALLAVGAHGVVVAHEQDGGLEAASAGFTDHGEGRLGRHAVLERDRVGLLDGRAVGDGVGEWCAELDDVGATALHGEEHIRGVLDPGVSGRDISNERGPLLGLAPLERLPNGFHCAALSIAGISLGVCMITIGRQRVEEEVEEEQRALDNWRKWESIRAQEAGPFMVWRSLRRFFGETTNRRNPVIFFS
jgi:hypothetical protein